MDWTTLIPLIIGVFIGAVVSPSFSMFENRATAWITSYFDNRVLTTHERQRFTLRVHYLLIKRMKDSPTYFNKVAFRTTTEILKWLVFLIGFTVLTFGNMLVRGSTLVSLAGVVMITFCIFFANSRLERMKRDINETIFFDEFQDETMAKITALGGNTGDLDREES